MSTFPHAIPLAPGPEFDLIRRFLARPVRPGDRPDVRVGPGDDTAVVVGNGIALSTDMSVEGVHFQRDWLTAREIGWRATAAALSDLAAMAARPIGVLCSLALPGEEASRMAVHLMDGVRGAAESVGGVLLGGDTTRSPGPIVLDVTVVGECARPVLRGGARAGDEVWVTGELGGASVYVQALLRGDLPDSAARRAFAEPRPRTAEALWLRAHDVPTAMIDLSDGLAGDAAHLAAAAGVAVVLDRGALPLHPAAARLGSPADGERMALSGGEDYELCFCAAPGAMEPLAQAFTSQFALRLTRVGRVEAGSGVWESAPGGTRVPLAAKGYQHFGEGR
jgi:thiamine-monophosphate kinase